MFPVDLGRQVFLENLQRISERSNIIPLQFAINEMHSLPIRCHPPKNTAIGLYYESLTQSINQSLFESGIEHGYNN